ncbi:MAG: hypothetical protein JWO10_511 [Microbacteriaceae bacterium]|nr:hypothetical protein [Microbacteriaceae bacterium]
MESPVEPPVDSSVDSPVQSSAEAPDEHTVIRQRSVQAAPAGPSLDEDLDADTVIRERRAFADLPAEALAAAGLKAVGLEAVGLDALVEPPRTARVPIAVAPVVVPKAVPPGAVQPAGAAALFYQFSVNYHEAIGLDRPALIGRKPALPRIGSGESPRLVRVPSPLREVSGSHLAIRQDGGSVIVTDLRSTNGTLVAMPGSEPVKLRQGESVVVSPGTVVDIGDGNIVKILPAHVVGQESS